MRRALVVVLIALAALAVFLLARRPSPVEASAVRIEAMGKLGSGVLLRGGLVLTVAHVVAGQKQVTVVTQLAERVEADVVFSSLAADVAVVRLKSSTRVEPSELSCAPPPPAGSRVVTMGNPGGFEFIMSWGRVASARVFAIEEDGARVFTIDMTIAPGSSGGPVYFEGRVVGVVDALMNVGTSSLVPALIPLSFVVPGSEVCRVLGLSPSS